MAGSPTPPRRPLDLFPDLPTPDPIRERAAAHALARARTLRFKSREHAYRSEVALDAGDLVAFEDNRHSARLECELADEDEGTRRSAPCDCATWRPESPGPDSPVHG